MKNIEHRIQALEHRHAETARALPMIVDDDAPQAKVERLRKLGYVVMRFSEAVDEFVV